ncbi:MAG: hypothetical protein B7733_19765 [Myxococcales bacterium FL481]|nr:MAG: hypothetical protein B7733_19765 [Myxococcales bacterium FL481]
MSESSHLRASLAAMAVFLAMGLWLEAMFGLRAQGWIDVPFRREFLRLGHAHGAILGLANVALAFSLQRLGTPCRWARRARAAGLFGAGLVGLGFCAGGLWPAPAGPGNWVYAVPVGAISTLAALLIAVVTRTDD